ncbi:MAG: prenyltransferase [Polyangiales bacterium]
MKVEAALLCDRERQITAEWLIAHQQPSGEILWSFDGKSDPWDHVHAAMGLAALGHHDAARAAYRYLARVQEPSGAFAAERVSGHVTRATHETNHAAYIATGVWHLYCATEDDDMLAELWPCVERAIDWVVSLQLPNGAIAWASKKGKVWAAPLITGSSSIHGSLVCALRIAARLGHERPAWHDAWRKLARVLQHDLGVFEKTDLPEPPGRYSMDWYYPVLGGALRGRLGRERLSAPEATQQFLSDGVGCRCVRDQPWYTVAETCELVLALDALGQRERARRMFGCIHAQRQANGAYWTGVTHPDGIVFPEGEQTTWTASAVVLAHDALSDDSATSSFFRDLDGRDLEDVELLPHERVARERYVVPNPAE